ncbi:MAG: VOC family protein [Candidatus Rokubacteria bacterium]|nr:VOC family protein [Candidatus Rokubacteria bacterium]
MNLRMRQICLVARQLAPVVEVFRDVFGLEACHRDPGVGKYGLENALFPTGNGFLEVVAPVRDGTTAGRYLERRGGDGGYMVITQCADLAPRRRWCDTLGVRVANEIRYPDYQELQLHPRDVGAAMLSFSRQEGGEPVDGPWHPAASRSTSAFLAASVRSMSGAELQSDDPERLARRWSEVMELPLSRDERSRPVIALDDARLRFVPVTDGRGEGLAGLDLDCADKGRLLSRARSKNLAAEGDMVVACGMRFYVV